jgi:predicted CopG family antitoxin
MKTISLTDEAYDRLRAWKDAHLHSFSAVVLKRVPPRGTLGALGETLDQLPTLTEKEARLLQQSVEWGNDWKQHRPTDKL